MSMNMKAYFCYALASLSPLCLAAGQACSSPGQCNQDGTAAYQAGHYDAAIEAFERQLRRAEVADDDAQRELALNNLMLATLKAGEPAMARAWLELALESGFDGSATRHNLAKVGAADLNALATAIEGRYLRYAGQAAWSVLEISRQGSGYRASFSPIRAGAQIEQYGPAAIGELEGTLQGSGSYFSLTTNDLGKDCAVDLLVDGLRARVEEVFAEGCQDYGGANISVGGKYYKVSPKPEA
ncbi:tetratricopeptide repeat protein [Pseudomonas sp. LRF_L74]|uniref:tetratricopeptide repeat protein n=1 Tax=Pseudomonas sp. LRF_L74 TaxID=3369422 RepID=UPI003F63DD61